jgi:asparagine synthase (glutamine-hydrolysing)
MCGITGIFDPAGGTIAAGSIEAMNGSIRHRGPDDDGVHVGPGIGLGAVRLSIQDLSPAGHMPMIDPETGNRLVFNGEVYNFKELPAELGLGEMRTGSDTEVVLRAYAKLGPACVEHFNGIFAFALWDEKKRRLFCARDRLGVKPFLYAWHDGRFHFASEAKALFAAGIEPRPDHGVIHDYLTHGLYEHGTRTFFASVEQLAPAHTLTLDGDRNEISRYWDLTAENGRDRGEARNFDQACDHFADLVQDAIRLQLRSDAPVAVHVSGGLDSTYLLAAINRVNGGQGATRAFSQVYGEAAYDEQPYVAALAEALGWEVDYHGLDVGEVPDLAIEAMVQQEQPFPGMVTLAKQKLMKSTHHHGAKVVLEGQGGDEIGGGYQYYLGPHVLDLVRRGETAAAAAEVAGFADLGGLDAAAAWTRTMNGLASYYRPGRSADGTVASRADCLDRNFVAAHTDHAGDTFPAPFDSDLLNMQYRDIFHTKLPRILRSCDRASMGYGRELRVPLLDHRLVEFTFALPAAFKIEGGVQRRFMRQALKSMVPAALAEAPKRAVVDPQRDWLRGPLRAWVGDTIASAAFAGRGLFDAERVRAAFADYVDGGAENSFHVWQWMSMELWFRTFIDADPIGTVEPARRAAL